MGDAGIPLRDARLKATPFAGIGPICLIKEKTLPDYAMINASKIKEKLADHLYFFAIFLFYQQLKVKMANICSKRCAP
ncbi:MAG: hypothetical protein AAGE37_01560 [Pseudomonadota bacterium]